MVDQIAKCVVIEPSSSMQQCIDDYDVEGEGDWVNNTISQNAEFWSCGMISRKPCVPLHDHDPNELARCHALANEASLILGKDWPMLRSGANTPTQPFFVAAQRGGAASKQMDEALIRSYLGDTLHPEARVIIEPLTEGTNWWQEIDEDTRGIVDDQPQNQFDEIVKPWRLLMKWFSTSGLSNASFVSTTDSKAVCYTLGCVFPYFIVGLSDKGSLIGVATHVVG